MLINVKVRINKQIRADEVRLIETDGEQVGIKKIGEALKIADEQGLDLVEVAPMAKPPVCRIMDYGKYKYEMEQKAKRARRHQTSIVIKEIKMRPKIEDHDFDVKKKHVERFLRGGAKVKVTIMFRGREMTHTDIGRGLLDRLSKEVEEMGVVESRPKLDGRNMIMILASLQTAKE